MSPPRPPLPSSGLRHARRLAVERAQVRSVSHSARSRLRRREANADEAMAVWLAN